MNDRLRAETEVIRKLSYPGVVRCVDVVEIYGRVGLVLDQAGDLTLAQRLRVDGRLPLDLLQRWGQDLLKAVSYLEEMGVPHRDLKPDNLGIARTGKDDALHLVLFDFSLSPAPLESIHAGTRTYLEPCLAERKPRRWDLAAERYAAAVTLHEMATGSHPAWGDGRSDPASLTCEVTLDRRARVVGRASREPGRPAGCPGPSPLSPARHRGLAVRRRATPAIRRRAGHRPAPRPPRRPPPPARSTATPPPSK